MEGGLTPVYHARRMIQLALANRPYHLSPGDLSQAASIINLCLNPISNSNTNDNMVSNGNCGGTVSQQGKSGQASTPTNPTIEVQRATTTAQPPLTSTDGNCTGCFDLLSAAQKSDFEGILQHNSMEVFGAQIITIDQLCTFLENEISNGEDPNVAIEPVRSLLGDVVGLGSSTIINIEECLLRALE